MWSQRGLVQEESGPGLLLELHLGCLTSAVRPVVFWSPALKGDSAGYSLKEIGLGFSMMERSQCCSTGARELKAPVFPASPGGDLKEMKLEKVQL